MDLRREALGHGEDHPELLFGDGCDWRVMDLLLVLLPCRRYYSNGSIVMKSLVYKFVAFTGLLATMTWLTLKLGDLFAASFAY